MADAKRHGTLLGPRGERQGGAKLTEAQVHEIRRRRGEGESRKSLEQAFGVAGATISNIVSRKNWGWL